MTAFKSGNLESVARILQQWVTMEIFNQEEECKGGEKHVVFLVLQKFKNPKKKQEWTQIQKMEPFIKIMRCIQWFTEMRKIAYNFLCQFEGFFHLPEIF